MTGKTMQTWQENSYLFEGSSAYLEELYESYLASRDSVSAEWQAYFDRLSSGATQAEVSHTAVREYFRAVARKPVSVAQESYAPHKVSDKQWQVLRLIEAYRQFGHFQAAIDPLGLLKPKEVPALSPNYYHLSLEDTTLYRFDMGESKEMTLKEGLALLKQVYCNTIGFEYAYLSSEQERTWLQQRIESKQRFQKVKKEQQLKNLELLVAAEGLEKYLGAKYVGQTRFSLEGGDSFIPQLHGLIKGAGQHGVQEVVIGMAHRGRLNVLINVLGKSPNDLFCAFEGKYQDVELAGDVKYHLGFSADLETDGGKIHVALAFNPSHLEIINPVVEGSVRARQDRRMKNGKAKAEVMPILVHGDAAFAGQGVVMETLNMSQTPGFGVGGTIHIITNNQIGFTISDPKDARSSYYCSDMAKMIESPVFHVNGDDLEAVMWVTQLALDYRMTFQKDVVIDLVCYRRYGHNEADEPTGTQPLMYRAIRAHKTPREIYTEKLVTEGQITTQQVNDLLSHYRDKLDKGEAIVKLTENKTPFTVDWSPYLHRQWDEPARTAVPLTTLQQLGAQVTACPASMVLQAQVKKEIELRASMYEGKVPLNWGAAETLAYASLVAEGFPVRLCGEDAGRGTFSHRHAKWHDNNTDDCYIPLNHVAPQQASFNVIDSLLSEEAVMGFEYGYASSAPNTLVIWEAQYGDFFNGAQVIVDQFISSSEVKWGRLSGLVLFLPHGYEGAGPEHSSARLERFLQLSAEDNMQTCVPSTPAQMFHLLRRQMLRPYRKPLVVLTPKSLLRHKLAVSSLEELTQGEFQLVIGEIDAIKATEVTKLVLCCGKVYYDLLAARREKNKNHIALIRIEQLYPFPKAAILQQLKLYSKAKSIVWCQEEPKNQGAFSFMQQELQELLPKGQVLIYQGRTESAAPAVGASKLHQKQQMALLEEVLG